MDYIGKEIAFGTLAKQVQESLVETKEIPRFFRSLFPDNISNATMCVYDEVFTKRNILGDDIPGGDAENFELAQYSELGFSPPFMHKAIPFSTWELFTRFAGGNPNVPTQMYKEFKTKLIKTAQVLKDSIDRTEEFYCASAMQTGIVPLNKQTSIDFFFKNTHKLGYSAGRNFAIDTVDPNKVFQDLSLTIMRDGNSSVETQVNVLMGDAVLDALQKSPFTEKRADIRRYEYMELGTGKPIPVGLIPQGTVHYGSFRFNLWSYLGMLENQGGTTVPLMDPKGLLMWGNGLKTEMFYGGIPDYAKHNQDMSMGVNATKLYTYQEAKGFTRKIGLATRPLPIIKTPDNIAFARIIE